VLLLVPLDTRLTDMRSRYFPLLLLACLPLCALHAEEEPTHGGKTVTELIEALKDEDEDVRKAVAEALKKIRGEE